MKTLLRVLGCMYLTTDTSIAGIKFFAWTFFIAEAVNAFAILIEVLNSEKN